VLFELTIIVFVVLLLTGGRITVLPLKILNLFCLIGADPSLLFSLYSVSSSPFVIPGITCFGNKVFVAFEVWFRMEGPLEEGGPFAEDLLRSFLEVIEDSVDAEITGKP